MFGTQKTPQDKGGRISMPSIEAAPELEVLSTMFEKATKNKPREVEQLFSGPGSGLTYSLSVRYMKDKDHPVWTLLEDNGMEAKMLWQQDSSDCVLIDDMVHMSAKTQANMNASMTDIPAQQHPGQSGGYNGFDPSRSLTGAPSSYELGRLSQQNMPVFTGTGTAQGMQGFGVPGATSQDMPAFSPTESNSRIENPHDLPNAQPSHGPRFSGVGEEKGVRAREGNLEITQLSTLVDALVSDEVTGRLELLGDESVGEIYFLNGIAMYAHVAGILGDSAVRELITWRTGSFAFFPGEKTDVRNVHRALAETVMEGIALLDKKRHLERMGLTTDAYLVKKHRNIGDTEIRLMLSKGEDIDVNLQIEVFKTIGHKYSLNDLLRDRPMESADWIPIVFNFLTCGLIDIKPPDAVKVGALDFLGDGKAQVDVILQSMVRPETGILAYSGFLLYLQQEFFRFEAYGWPLSVVLFEMTRKKDYDSNRKGGELQSLYDSLPPAAVQVAAKRIEMIKRPLDILGHFEMLEYAILLPNTKTASAAYIANRILQTLTVTPLATNIDKKSLKVAFGVANLPADGETVQDLLNAARAAKEKAAVANFPLIISKSLR